MKMYIDPTNDENIVTREEILDYMTNEGISELKVEIAEKLPFSTGIFYCGAVGEVCEKSEGDCGKLCEHYRPRNGKSGMCRNQRHAYESTHEFEIIQI